MLSLIACLALNGYLFSKPVLMKMLPGKEYTSLFILGNRPSTLLELDFSRFELMKCP